MAINSINKDFSKKRKDVNLLAKDFSSYKQKLIDFSKTYFPNTYNDFTEGSTGNMFIELVSYVGDVLSYNIDYNFKESLLTNASEEKNIIKLAQSLGYKVPLSSGAVTSLKIYQLLPDNGSGSPDWKYALKVNDNMKIGSNQNSDVIFRTLEPIDFSDMKDLSNVDDYLELYQENNGTPQFWLVEYYRDIPVIAGQEKELTVNVGDPEKFYTVELPDDDVIDIISVVDSDGNKYYEVDYLAQDSIISQIKVDRNEEPFYQPKILKVPRRFITKVNKNLKKVIQFGAGTTVDIDEETISSIFQADNKVGSTELAIDPSSFSTSKTYGKAPANTTLTIKYTVGGGIESNVGQNDLTDINEIVYANDTSTLSDVEKNTLNQIKTTLTVTNESKASGGRGKLSPNEIRENALAFFNAQKRCVTARDYESRIFSMPSRFGNISKVYVEKSSAHKNNTTNSPTINCYLLSYDNNNKLTNLNSQTKKNVSIFLNEFRMLTDGVNLLDGYVVNIGVDFEISVYSSYNKSEVLLKAIETVKNFFDIDIMNFNQPIYINDLELQLGNVDGVRTVNSVKLINKTLDDGDYSSTYYPIQSATRNKIVYPSVEPSVFEIKYPNSDIKGRVR